MALRCSSSQSRSGSSARVDLFAQTRMRSIPCCARRRRPQHAGKIAHATTRANTRAIDSHDHDFHIPRLQIDPRVAIRGLCRIGAPTIAWGDRSLRRRRVPGRRPERRGLELPPRVLGYAPAVELPWRRPGPDAEPRLDSATSSAAAVEPPVPERSRPSASRIFSLDQPDR